MNKITKVLAYGAIAAFALAGCGSNVNSPQAPSSQANLNSNVLQFAVGTVNLFGTANAGLNVVTTYRQTNGDSGVLLSSPTITLPAAIGAGAAAPAGVAMGYDACSTAALGAGTTEVGTTTITSTSQSPGASTTPTTFGQSGGVFGLGIEPFNSTAQADCTPPGAGFTGTPFQVTPYPVPLWDTTNAGCGTAPACDPNQLDAAFGGPPAITQVGSNGDSVAGSSTYGSPNGLSLGIDVFQMPAPAAAVGTYSLAVSIPANTGTTTASKSFALAAVTDLGTAGAAPAFVENGSGGGTVGPLTPPAGAWTEALVEVIDYPAADATAGAGGGIYYTMEATAAGATTWCTAVPVTCTLPNSIGPGSTATVPVGSITAGDQIVTQVIYTDYPIYELQYGIQTAASTGKQSPTLLGAAGSADMSISTATCEQSAGACTAPLPLLHARIMGHVTHRSPSFIKKTR